MGVVGTLWGPLPKCVSLTKVVHGLKMEMFTSVSCPIITGAAMLSWVCMCLLLAANVRLGFRREEYLIISTEFLDTKIFVDVALSRLPTLAAALCVLCNLVKTKEWKCRCIIVHGDLVF